MNKLLSISLILTLAACASSPRPAPAAKKPVAKEVAKPSSAPAAQPAPTVPTPPAPAPAAPQPVPAPAKVDATPAVKYSCFKITVQQARSLYAQGHTYLDRDGDGRPCEWPDKAKELDEESAAKPGSKCTTSKAYTKADGTKVPAKTRCTN